MLRVGSVRVSAVFDDERLAPLMPVYDSWTTIAPPFARISSVSLYVTDLYLFISQL